MRVLTGLGAVHPDQMPFDVAERKGIGHPDSLADLVADSFSRRYAHLCQEQFGVVPNHWVDKVNLVGAAADVRFAQCQTWWAGGITMRTRPPRSLAVRCP